MNEPIQLTSDRGTLRISRALPELKSALSFKHVFTAPGREYSYVDKKTGKKVTRKTRGAITSDTEDLFTEIDGALFTHTGMLSRTCSTLKKLGFEYEYERTGPPFASPTLNAAVVRGLYPEQKEGVIHLLASHGGGMLEGATGLGKTFILAALVRAYPKVKILILTKAAAVVRGLYKSLNDLLKPDGVEVGIMQGNNRQPKRVTVCTNALGHSFDSGEIGVVICDECHSVTGDATSEVVLKYSSAIRYGLSATCSKRWDGKHKFLEAIFGPIAYTVTDQEAESLGRVCPLHAYFLACDEGPEVDHLTDDKREKQGIWLNPQRNALAKEVCDLCPPEFQLLIFVRTVAHMNHLLEHYLTGFEYCHGDMPNKDRLEVERRFISGESKRVISTDCMSTGIDPSNLRVCVDLSGVLGDAAMVQKRGRLRRHAEGKDFGVLINFDDAWSEKLSRKAAKRVKEHRDRGDTVIEYCKPEDIQFVKST